MPDRVPKPDFSSQNLKTRLKTLSDFVQDHPRSQVHGHINLHVHTNESFSVFQNPTEAVWYAYVENIEYFGINDHYTIDGHDEFRKACEIASLKPIFSVEAIAMDTATMKAGRRFNDPNNPGRCYLVGKGVTLKLRPGSNGSKTLETMRSFIRKRNRNIVQKLNGYCSRKGLPIELSYNEVEALTPRKNATERHVVQALCEKISRQYADADEQRSVYTTLLDVDVDESVLFDSAKLQTLVRARLIKSSMPCYVEEDNRAFTSIENLVNLWLEYGAIPIYPLMGNPITEEEGDLDELFKKMQKLRLHGLEMIDYRTEVTRAAQIIDAARDYGYPVFIGSEHNTKKMIPLIGPVSGTRDFYEYFRKSANFVIGHQLLMELCDFGFVTSEGERRYNDRKEGFRFFEEIGEVELSKEQIEELKKKDLDERKKYFGI